MDRTIEQVVLERDNFVITIGLGDVIQVNGRKMQLKQRTDMVADGRLMLVFDVVREPEPVKFSLEDMRYELRMAYWTETRDDLWLQRGGQLMFLEEAYARMLLDNGGKAPFPARVNPERK